MKLPFTAQCDNCGTIGSCSSRTAAAAWNTNAVIYCVDHVRCFERAAENRRELEAQVASQPQEAYGG